MVEGKGTGLDTYGSRGGNTFWKLSTSKLRLKSKKLFIFSLSFEIVSVTFELMSSIGQLEIFRED